MIGPVVNLDSGADFRKKAWEAFNEGTLEGFLKGILNSLSGEMEAVYDLALPDFVKSLGNLSNSGTALISLANEAASHGLISLEDARTLIAWAQEYGINGRGPEVHPNTPLHVNIGNVHLFIK